MNSLIFQEVDTFWQTRRTTFAMRAPQHECRILLAGLQDLSISGKLLVGSKAKSTKLVITRCRLSRSSIFCSSGMSQFSINGRYFSKSVRGIAPSIHCYSLFRKSALQPSKFELKKTIQNRVLLWVCNLGHAEHKFLLRKINELKVAHLDDESSNALFEILEDWNSYLQAEKIDPERPQIRRRGPSL